MKPLTADEDEAFWRAAFWRAVARTNHAPTSPKPGTKTREWYQENDPQSLVDSIGGTK